jgi:hypothetical protein
MTACFGIRRPIIGAFAGTLPIGNGFLYQIGFGVMVRDQFGLCGNGFRKARFQQPGDLLVILPPRAPE